MKKKKRKNPPDATLRNVKAYNKKFTELIKALNLLSIIVGTLTVRIEELESKLRRKKTR